MKELWIPIIDNKNMLNGYVLSERDKTLLSSGTYYAELYDREHRTNIASYGSINFSNAVAIIRYIDIANKQILISIIDSNIISDDYKLVARIRGIVKEDNPMKLMRLIGFDIEIIENGKGVY